MHVVRWTKIFESTPPLNLFILCEGNVFATLRHPTLKRSQMYPQIDAFPVPGHVTPAFFLKRNIYIRVSYQYFMDVGGFYVIFT